MSADAVLGRGDIALVLLDADELPVEPPGDEFGRADAREGIEDNITRVSR